MRNYSLTEKGIGCGIVVWMVMVMAVITFLFIGVRHCYHAWQHGGVEGILGSIWSGPVQTVQTNMTNDVSNIVQ